MVTEILLGCTVSRTHCSSLEAKRWGSSALSQRSLREHLNTNITQQEGQHHYYQFLRNINQGDQAHSLLVSWLDWEGNTALCDDEGKLSSILNWGVLVEFRTPTNSQRHCWIKPNQTKPNKNKKQTKLKPNQTQHNTKKTLNKTKTFVQLEKFVPKNLLNKR